MLQGCCSPGLLQHGLLLDVRKPCWLASSLLLGLLLDMGLCWLAARLLCMLGCLCWLVCWCSWLPEAGLCLLTGWLSEKRHTVVPAALQQQQQQWLSLRTETCSCHPAERQVVQKTPAAGACTLVHTAGGRAALVPGRWP